MPEAGPSARFCLPARSAQSCPGKASRCPAHPLGCHKGTPPVASDRARISSTYNTQALTMPSTGKAESAKNKKMLGQQVRTAIEALHAENEELKKDLARETRQANLTATMGKGQGSQAARLQEEADLYLKKIENERNKIATLDAKISQCKKEMTAQRQKMGGVNAGKENHDMLVKQIKLMEKKLARCGNRTLF